jgi:hypothetical protein
MHGWVGIKIVWMLDAEVFQNVISKLVQDMEYVKTTIHLDDLLILNK